MGVSWTLEANGSVRLFDPVHIYGGAAACDSGESVFSIRRSHPRFLRDYCAGQRVERDQRQKRRLFPVFFLSLNESFFFFGMVFSRRG